MKKLAYTIGFIALLGAANAQTQNAPSRGQATSKEPASTSSVNPDGTYREQAPAATPDKRSNEQRGVSKQGNSAPDKNSTEIRGNSQNTPAADRPVKRSSDRSSKPAQKASTTENHKQPENTPVQRGPEKVKKEPAKTN